VSLLLLLSIVVSSELEVASMWSSVFVVVSILVTVHVVFFSVIVYELFLRLNFLQISVWLITLLEVPDVTFHLGFGGRTVVRR